MSLFVEAFRQKDTVFQPIAEFGVELCLFNQW